MEPYRTAEARWFQRGEIPAAVRAWFDGLGPTVEPQSRTDRYLAPASAALGVKLREGQVEAKRRTGALAPLAYGRAEAPVEAWAKWSLPLAEAASAPGDGWVAVEKTRWQRHAGDCALELSRVTVAGAPWWSVCLEAIGADDGARRAALAEASHRWLGGPDAPALNAADAQSYPAWLFARTL